MFQQGKKETTKKFQLEILATNFATQVQQKSRMPTENDVRGSVTFKEKVFFFSVLKLKYLNTKVDKLTKENHNI